MGVSGLFWVVTVVMAAIAIGFVARPLFKGNRNAMLACVAIVVPLLAIGLYMYLGSPDSADTLHHAKPSRDSGAAGAAGAAMSEDKKLGSVASLVDGLASRLRENPDDGGNWLLLARSYKYLDRTDEAMDAYQHAVQLGQFDAELDAMSSGTAQSGTTSVDTPATGAQIVGNVTLSPDVADIVLPTDTVFIFAKAVHGPPAPLAILQRPASELPIEFMLNDTQSMIAGMKLSDYDEVIVTARISRGGDATVALKGLEAKSDPILVADNRHLNLTIK
jgi:tetratricopeptide (TPR) repeat protein